MKYVYNIRFIFIILLVISFIALISCNDPGYPYSVYDTDVQKFGDNANRGKILMTEVGWSGSVDKNGNYDPDDDFIELQNNSEFPVNISNWVFVFKGAVNKMVVVPPSYANVIYPNKYFVIAKTKSKAYPNADLEISDLIIPEGYWQITLRTKDFRLDEPIGRIENKALAGSYDGITCRSMERSSNNFKNRGNDPNSWHTYVFNPDYPSSNGIYVGTDYKDRTFGSPGTVNSKQAYSPGEGDEDDTSSSGAASGV